MIDEGSGALPRAPGYLNEEETGTGRRFGFLCEADRLKSVERANVLMDLSRPENSAEHSWHVALYAMVFGASDRAIAMLLLHDLVEIDVGDHPIHLNHDAAALAAAEDAAARRLFGMLPGGDAALALWREFEAGQSADARMAKRMDHVQPMFQVLLAPAPLAPAGRRRPATATSGTMRVCDTTSSSSTSTAPSWTRRPGSSRRSGTRT